MTGEGTAQTKGGQLPGQRAPRARRGHAVQVSNGESEELEAGRVDAAKAVIIPGYTAAQSFGMIKRVINQVGKKWDIFRPQIELLLAGALFLQEIKGRTFEGQELLKRMGYRVPSSRAKMTRWIERCADSGIFFRVKYKRGASARHPNGYGFGLTEKGLMIIEDFDKECAHAHKWYADRELKRLSDCVIYLDKIGELSKTFQEVILTDDQRQQLRDVGIE